MSTLDWSFQSEDEEDVKENYKQSSKNYSRKSRFEADHSPEVRRKTASDESDPEESEIDDEEKQKRLVGFLCFTMTHLFRIQNLHSLIV